MPSEIDPLQPRHVARELALLSLSQISGNPKTLAERELDELVLAAIRTLQGEMQETIDTAKEEVQRGNEQLLHSETRATSVQSATAMVGDALQLTQSAINKLARAAILTRLPEFVKLGELPKVRTYAIDIIGTVKRRRIEIDAQLEQALVDWQLNRLPRIDRDILRIAVAEIMFLDVDKKVAINEAVELAKMYSDEDGYRFINGVMRRVTNNLKSDTYQEQSQGVS